MYKPSDMCLLRHTLYYLSHKIFDSLVYKKPSFNLVVITCSMQSPHNCHILYVRTILGDNTIRRP